jgi:CBF1 interacting corepressor
MKASGVSGVKKKTKEVTNEVANLEFLYNAPPGYVPDQKSDQSLDQRLDDVVRQEASGAGKSYKECLEEQKMTQYPFLANAPLEGVYVQSQEHTLHPVGVVLRNVKCAKCGLYGHRAFEKACPMLGVVTEEDVSLQKMQDPLKRMKHVHQLDKKFVLTYKDDPVIGGVRLDDEVHQLLVSEGEDISSSSEDELEQSFLQSLSRKQMKTLLKEYKREAKKAEKKKKKKGDAEGRKGEKRDANGHKKEENRDEEKGRRGGNRGEVEGRKEAKREKKREKR